MVSMVGATSLGFVSLFDAHPSIAGRSYTTIDFRYGHMNGLLPALFLKSTHRLPCNHSLGSRAAWLALVQL